MNKFRRILVKAAQKLDLPQDIAAGLPCIQLRGFEECSLDQHRGILAYEPDEIVIRLNSGTLTIRGTELEVCLMHRDRLCVRGRIRELGISED